MNDTSKGPLGLRSKRAQVADRAQKARRSRTALTVLGCMVAFATAFALMLPAISMTQDALVAGVFSGEEVDDVSSEAESFPAQAFSDELTNAKGEVTLSVAVDAPEGALPAGTTMRLEHVAAKTVRESVEGAVAKDSAAGEVKSIQAVDISFIDAQGIEVEPLNAVSVRLASPKIADAAADEKQEPLVVHVDDRGEASVVETLTDKQLSQRDMQLSVDELAFDAEAFSVYAIAYTVDFEYAGDDEGSEAGESDGAAEGAEGGESGASTTSSYKYHLAGGGSMLLSELFEQLNVRANLADVIDVEFSDPALLKVEFVSGDGNDWLLQSLKPFTSQEKLTITLASGNKLVVKVTDAQGDPLDGVLVNVSIDGAQVNGTTWTVQKGQTYTLHFDFKETAGDTAKQINLDNAGGVYLTLPAGFAAVSLENAELPLEENGTALQGNTFSVRDGKLYLNLTDEAKEKIRTGNAIFGLDISGVFNSSQTNMEFSSTIKRDVEVKEDHDLSVSKSALYQEWDNHVKYTVTVTSTGYNQNVRIADVVNGSAVTIDQGAGYGVQVSGNSGTPTTTVAADGKSFETVLSSMNDGETVTITYWGKLANSANGAAPSASLTGNTATGTTGTVTKTAEAHIENTISWHNIEKQAGASTGEGTTKTLPWTITVNANKSEDLSGATVTDRIASDNMSYDTTTPITVEVYQANPDNFYYDGAPIKTLTVNWNAVTLGDDGKSFTYTLPDDAGNYKYVIKYNTTVTVPADSITNSTVGNTADVDKGTVHDGTTGTGTVGPAVDVQLKKQVVKSTASTVEWKYSFVVPAGGLSSAVLTDIYPHRGNQYLDALDASYDVQVNIENQQAGESWSIDKQSDRMVITFTNDGSSGLAGTGQARTVTVYLRTSYDSEWLETAPSEGHTNVVDLNGGLQAQATATPGVETGLSKTAASVGKITLADGKQHALYKYTLVLSGVSGDVEIQDTFDSSLAYFNIYDTANWGNADISAQYASLGISTDSDEVFYSAQDNSGGKTLPSDYPYTVNDGRFKVGYSRTVGEGALTLNVALDKLPLSGTQPYNTYTFTYYLVANDLDNLNARSQDAHGPITLNNSATWTDAENGTATAQVEYQYPVVDKTMTGLGENAASGEFATGALSPSKAFAAFQIVVNADRTSMPLDETTDKVKLTDEFSGLSVDYSTIKVYREDASGARTDVTGSTDWNYSGYTGTFYLEDRTKYVITYQARIIGEGSITFGNTAKVNGYSSKVEETAQVEGSGGGEVQNYWIRIYKYEGYTMNKPVGGAVYALLDENGDPMVYPTTAKTTASGKAGTEITFTTGENGYARVFLSEEEDGVSLQKGIKYYLKEIAAPAGYQVNPTIYNFTISDHPNYENTSNYEYYIDDILKIWDNPREGVLEIDKGVTIDGNADAGSTLTQAQKKRIVFTISGTRLDGEPFETVTVDYSQFANGKYLMENLKPGTYVVTETSYDLYGFTYEGTVAQSVKSNEGESVADYTFTFTIPSDEAANTEHVVSYTNTYTSAPYSLTVKKAGPQGQALSGAEFTLEVKKDGNWAPAQNGSVADDGTFAIPYESRKSGVTLYNLADGEYRIAETKAPNGYRATAGVFTFTVAGGKLTSSSGDSQLQYVAGANDQSGVLTVVNTVEYGYTFTKAEAGATTTRLPGAEFSVYCFDATASGGQGALVETLTTDANGQFEILKSNNAAYRDGTLYYVVETAAPEGYQTNDEKRYFYWGNYDLANATGYATTANTENLGSAQMYALVEDEPQTVNIRVKKAWSGVDAPPVDSIEFKVYRTETTPGSDPVKKQYPDEDTVFTLSKGAGDSDTLWTQLTNANLLKNLPLGKSADGVHTVYSYSVEEVMTDALAGLESVVSVREAQWDGDGTYDVHTITNRPETVDVSIRKVWVDDGSHADKQKVMLYRKNGSGKDNWGGIPWSDSPYMLTGCTRTNNTNGGAEIELSAANDWVGTISGLEKGDARDPWVYYVEEDTVSGYEAPVISEGISATGTITVTNTKKTTGIAVRKVWDVPAGEEVPESVTVNLMEASATPSKDGIEVRIYDASDYSDDIPKATVCVKAGSDVVLSGNPIQNGGLKRVEVTGRSAITSVDDASATTKTVTIANITEAVDIKFYCSWGQGKELKWDYTADVVVNKGGAAVKDTATLSASTNWYKEWTSGLDATKYYYIEETKVGDQPLADAGYAVSYSNNDGITTGTITATNTKLVPGSLNVAKQLTVDSASPTEENKALASGIFTFQVAASGDSAVLHTLAITYENGEVAGATLDGEAAEVGADGFVEVSDLAPGDYVITEEAPTGGFSLASIEGGKGDGDTSTRTITVTVANGQSGDNVAADGKATFTNNVNTRTITVTKAWRDGLSSTAPQGASATVELYKDGEPCSPRRTVTLTGKESPAWQASFTVPQDGSLYTMVETNASPASFVLADIDVVSAGTGRDLYVRADSFEVDGEYLIVAGNYVLGVASGSLSLGAASDLTMLGDGLVTGGVASGQVWKANDTSSDRLRFFVQNSGSYLGYSGSAWGLKNRRETGVTIAYADGGVANKDGHYLDFAGGSISDAAANPGTIKIFKKVSVSADGNLDYFLTNEKAENAPGTATLNIVKVNADDMKTPLSGAAFMLKKLNLEGTGDYDRNFTERYSAETDDNGTTAIDGIENGYYEVNESTVPDGYIIVGSGAFYIKAENGTVTLLEKPATDTLVTSWPEMTTATGDVLQFNATTATATVGNTPGQPLPNAGGAGLGVLYLVGGLLVALASCILALARPRVRTPHNS